MRSSSAWATAALSFGSLSRIQPGCWPNSPSIQTLSSSFECRAETPPMYASSGVIRETVLGTRSEIPRRIECWLTGRNRCASVYFWMARKVARWSSATIAHRWQLRPTPRCTPCWLQAGSFCFVSGPSDFLLGPLFYFPSLRHLFRLLALRLRYIVLSSGRP